MAAAQAAAIAWATRQPPNYDPFPSNSQPTRTSSLKRAVTVTGVHRRYSRSDFRRRPSLPSLSEDSDSASARWQPPPLPPLPRQFEHEYVNRASNTKLSRSVSLSQPTKQDFDRRRAPLLQKRSVIVREEAVVDHSQRFNKVLLDYRQPAPARPSITNESDSTTTSSDTTDGEALAPIPLEERPVPVSVTSLSSINTDNSSVPPEASTPTTSIPAEPSTPSIGMPIEPLTPPAESSNAALAQILSALPRQRSTQRRPISSSIPNQSTEPSSQDATQFGTAPFALVRRLSRRLSVSSRVSVDGRSSRRNTITAPIGAIPDFSPVPTLPPISLPDSPTAEQLASLQRRHSALGPPPPFVLHRRRSNTAPRAAAGAHRISYPYLDMGDGDPFAPSEGPSTPNSSDNHFTSYPIRTRARASSAGSGKRSSWAQRTEPWLDAVHEADLNKLVEDEHEDAEATLPHVPSRLARSLRGGPALRAATLAAASATGAGAGVGDVSLRRNGTGRSMRGSVVVGAGAGAGDVSLRRSGTGRSMRGNVIAGAGAGVGDIDLRRSGTGRSMQGRAVLKAEEQSRETADTRLAAATHEAKVRYETERILEDQRQRNVSEGAAQIADLEMERSRERERDREKRFSRRLSRQTRCCVM